MNCLCEATHQICWWRLTLVNNLFWIMHNNPKPHAVLCVIIGFFATNITAENCLCYYEAPQYGTVKWPHKNEKVYFSCSCNKAGFIILQESTHIRTGLHRSFKHSWKSSVKTVWRTASQNHAIVIRVLPHINLVVNIFRRWSHEGQPFCMKHGNALTSSTEMNQLPMRCVQNPTHPRNVDCVSPIALCGSSH